MYTSKGHEYVTVGIVPHILNTHYVDFTSSGCKTHFINTSLMLLFPPGIAGTMLLNVSPMVMLKQHCMELAVS